MRKCHFKEIFQQRFKETEVKEKKKRVNLNGVSFTLATIPFVTRDVTLGHQLKSRIE